jgi:hypothetical protein
LTGGTALAEDQVYFFNLSFSEAGVSGELTTPGNLTAPNQPFTPDLLSYTTGGPQGG